MRKEEVLIYLFKYLVFVLDELTEAKSTEEFVVGEITAYAECLEILSFWDGFNGYGTGEIVKKYQIK